MICNLTETFPSIQSQFNPSDSQFEAEKGLGEGFTAFLERPFPVQNDAEIIKLETAEFNPDFKKTDSYRHYSSPKKAPH